MAAISTFVAAAGLGLSAFGAMQSFQGAQGSAEAQQGITEGEMRLEEQRRKAMMISSRRNRIQLVRQAQQARSLALSSGVNQGAEGGSGVQGGMAQTTAQGAFNTLGVDQNLMLGQNMFNINADISQYRMALAAAQGQMYTGQGMQSMGSNLMNILPQISRLGQGFGGGGGSQMASNPNQYNPYWLNQPNPYRSA